MSDLYYKQMVETGGEVPEAATEASMREWSKRKGRYLQDGKPKYTTEQNHKDECDINHIIAKYDKTGLLTHVTEMETRFGDVTGFEYREMVDTVINANRMFDELPAKVKKRFGNDTAAFLEFFDDPDNRDEAIKLGLIDARWKEDRDGLGEHVIEHTADDYKDPADEKAAG